ncbi:MAG TPA: proton-conducting transporter membrane subunit [Kiritimatiellia bacterium]|nr:proton-conducting transporter membrane subunit [Kiritimatiellia bacterium]HMP34122.1 proton-conducting transporter membrane subunit [Kiritimatiellia bacterium]
MMHTLHSLLETASRPHGGGDLLVLAILLPIVALLLIVLTGGRFGRAITLASLVPGLFITGAIAHRVWTTRTALVERVGGWEPPLGLMLRADGLSVLMLVTTALLVAAVALYAPRDFRVPAGAPETRTSLVFWVMLLAIWASLNSIFLGHDLFNLYVALELIAFAAIPLVYLEGKKGTVMAGLRYLLFALMGSMLYLLGTALLYSHYGTMDLTRLAAAVNRDWVVALSVALMTVGLMAKTALFPMHLWLPPAHSGATPAASALLSALVVKGSFFLILRIWFDLAPAFTGTPGAQAVGVLGAGAVLICGVLAVRQTRLKLLIAYSTAAQIGYLFLIFPLAKGAGFERALSGGVFHILSHGFAKASMFMTAGMIVAACGHDRLAELRGVMKTMPVATIAFVLAALSLVGVPPTGGFIAKGQLLSSAVLSAQWPWVVVILAGGLLTGAYMFRALSSCISPAPLSFQPLAPVSRIREWLVLALAVIALWIGMFPGVTTRTLEIGRPAPLEARP